MYVCQVTYEDLLDQKLSHPDPMAGVMKYFSDRGARVRSGRFEDPSLTLTNDLHRDVLEIIKSGRKQEFERIKVDFSRETAEKMYGSQPLFTCLQRVIVEWEHSPSVGTLVITYPDRVFFETVIWTAKGRTNFHKNWLNSAEMATLMRHYDSLFTDARCDLDRETLGALTKSVEFEKFLSEVRDDDFF